jgi:signal transduction histidine kinase
MKILSPTLEGGIGLALTQALDAMSDIYVVYDSEWRFVYHNAANKAAMQMAGLDPESAIGKVVWEYMPFLVGTIAHAESLRAKHDGIQTSWEESYPPNIRLRGRAFPTSDGGVAVVAQNISEEWRAERARREAADRTATFLKTSAALAGTITLDHLARVILNDGAAALNARAGAVGIVRDDGESVEIIASQGYADGVIEAFQNFPVTAHNPLADAIRSGSPIVLRSAAHRNALYPELSGFVQRVGEGAASAIPLVVNDRVVGVIGFLFDENVQLEQADIEFMTALAQQFAQAADRARLYEAEKQARIEAESANLAKTEFLTMMSHELRTPLNAIGGYADLIEAGIRGPVTEEQATDLQRIKRSQRHLLSLINDVLNFAKLQAGSVAIVTELVDLNVVVGDIEALVTPQLLEKHLDYRYVPSRDECIAIGDAEKIEQILLNLLSNAIKFSEAGDMIEISVHCEDETVLIKARDTGSGIAADKLEAVFEPFVQLNRGKTNPLGGTGLGLSISRDLARLMHGDLTVESTLGVGSTFCLRLPRYIK